MDLLFMHGHLMNDRILYGIAKHCYYLSLIAKLALQQTAHVDIVKRMTATSTHNDRPLTKSHI